MNNIKYIECFKFITKDFLRLLNDYSDDAFNKESAVEALRDAFFHYESINDLLWQLGRKNDNL